MNASIVRFESRTLIQRLPVDVFACLADLPDYSAWMHRTGMFRRCTLAADEPVRKGTTYTDSTRLGTFDGEITKYVPGSRLAFEETLSWFGSLMMRARPQYTLHEEGSATIVHHVAVGELYGFMRLMKPAAGWLAKRERSRTLACLKRSLESSNAANPRAGSAQAYGKGL